MAEMHPETKLTLDLFQDYSSARTNWARQATEDNEFRAGKQWSTKQVNALRNRAQEPVVVNVIHPAVEQAKAMLTSNKPRFQSTGREDSDVKVGRLFADLMAWVWDTSLGNTQLKQAIDDYYVKGMGVLLAYIEPVADFGRGEVMIKSVDPLSVYFDPSSADPFCRDSASIITAKRITEKALVMIYPEFEEIIRAATETSHINDAPANRFGLFDEDIVPSSRKTAFSQQEDERELEIFERYTKIMIPYYRVFDPFTETEHVFNDPQYSDYREKNAVMVTGKAGSKIFTDDETVAKYLTLMEQLGPKYHLVMDPNSGQPVPTPGREDINSIPESETTIDPLMLGDLIDEEKIMVNKVEVYNVKQCVNVGDEYLFSTILPVEDYPIVPMMNGYNRNPYPMSDVRLVRGLQEYINKIRSLIVAHASSSTNVKLLIPRGSMNKEKLEEEWGRAGTAVIEFDPELGKPIVAGPVPLPNELYKNEAEAKRDVENILGLYSTMQGSMEKSPATFKGTIAIDEFGQRRIKSKKDDVESCLNQIAKAVVGLIQYVYTTEKTMRLLQPNNKPKEVKINEILYDNITGEMFGKLNDITVGKYDVIVVSGSTLPSNRWARFEYYMELYKNKLIDQTEVLKQTDVADMEGVLERAGQMQKMQKALKQQAEQIKSLKGDLQTAQRESVHDRKRVEIKEFEKKLAKAEAKAEMITSVYRANAAEELNKLKGIAKRAEKETKSPPTDEEILG